ncbi:primosomal protein N' [Microvenator marinus]|uniref:Replication restart protein PriA n=1 Tax=Microvenator marinus TaxID=2600177 RepID=A0A5B8Y1A9_9DELT|nr:primosomal protein N' [Microvenator marinus]
MHVSETKQLWAEVAVDVPVFAALSYAVPPAFAGMIRAGQLVQVPFRNKSKTGLVMRVTAEAPDFEGKIRDILDIVDRNPLLNETGLNFLKFVSEYYMSPMGEVMRLAVPSAARVEGIKWYVRTPYDGVLEEDLSAAYALIEDKIPLHLLREKSDLPFARLSELESLGAVDVEYVDESALKPKTEAFFKLSGKEPESRVGAKQDEILTLLHELKEASMEEIKARVNSPYSSLKSLEERGLLIRWEVEVYRDPFKDAVVDTAISPSLTEQQSRALSAINAANGFGAFLLHGVTGSGKTMVYVEAIRALRAAGERALILLPEIALTPQFVGVFRSFFGDDIAVLHSGLSQAQKFDQWRRIQKSDVSIVIGARSAVFAPIENLGMIIVDEEHDPSFKQEEGPRYNARDLALMRGKLEGARVILGSATPSLESFQNALEGRITLLRMPIRVQSRPLPPVSVVDMRRRSDLAYGVLSGPLLDSMTKSFMAAKQSILFLNRRGYSPCVVCSSCGFKFMCSQCDVSLTYHRRQESLRCHHCDFSVRLPETCPECTEATIGPMGVGTEKLEEILGELFPNRRVERLDRDTGTGGGLQNILKKVNDGEVDILVGTQMVTKGHDFPGVTTVGVVLADMSLNFPDFRAAERTFQLLTQVAGRAGRGDDPGEVVVQTYSPEHYSLETAARHDFEGFAERELALRKELKYPPFAHMIAIKFEATLEGAVIQAARDYATTARRILRKESGLSDVVVVGPAIAPIEKLRGRTRYQLLFRCSDRSKVRRVVGSVLNHEKYFDPAGKTEHRNVRIVVDIDPLNLL